MVKALAVPWIFHVHEVSDCSSGRCSAAAGEIYTKATDLIAQAAWHGEAPIRNSSATFETILSRSTGALLTS